MFKGSRGLSIPALMVGLLLSVLVPRVVFAEAGGAAREAARQRFVAGVELIQQERWEEGLQQFEESYRVFPTQAALFNRALCLRLLRRYGEAMDVLAEYRRLYSGEVSADRMAEVDAELATIRGLIGRVNVTLEGPTAAEVYIDGERAGVAPTTSPLVVAPGRHDVEVRAAGFAPYRHSLTLSSGDELDIRATMERAVTNASLTIRVNVPGAQVSIDGAGVGTSPLSAPVPVVAGEHRIEVNRDGYQRSELSLGVEANGEATANIELRQLGQLPANLAGELSLSLSQPDAEVFVNGAPYTGGPLPIGPHDLEVHRDGFRNFRERVEINQGQTTQIEVAMVPGTSEPAAPGGGRNRTLLISGIVTGAVGLALAVTGGALLGWNSGRFDEWQTEDDRLAGAWGVVGEELDDNVPVSELSYDLDVLNSDTRENRSLSDSISTVEILSWVFVGVGGAAVAAGVTLLVLGLLDREEPAAQVSVSPTRGGLTFGLTYAF